MNEVQEKKKKISCNLDFIKIKRYKMMLIMTSKQVLPNKTYKKNSKLLCISCFVWILDSPLSVTSNAIHFVLIHYITDFS